MVVVVVSIRVGAEERWVVKDDPSDPDPIVYVDLADCCVGCLTDEHISLATLILLVR